MADKKMILSGDGAIAYGAKACGVTLGAGYPGTSSTGCKPFPHAHKMVVVTHAITSMILVQRKDRAKGPEAS